MKQITHAFIVSNQATRVGFAQITDLGHIDFTLDQYNEMQTLDAAIDAVPLKAGNKSSPDNQLSKLIHLFFKRLAVVDWFQEC